MSGVILPFVSYVVNLYNIIRLVVAWQRVMVFSLFILLEMKLHFCRVVYGQVAVSPDGCEIN